MIIQGPHGYVSPSWYPPRPSVPTWNFVVAHLYGTPELVDAEENLAVLARLVERFERRVPQSRLMGATPDLAEQERQTSLRTVGFRLTPTRIVAKQKMSQNKPADVAASVLAHLEGDGPYADPALACEMRLARE